MPITLLDGAVTRHGLEAGAVVTEADVDVPDTPRPPALDAHRRPRLKGSHAA